jgi:hypothetical protein
MNRKLFRRSEIPSTAFYRHPLFTNVVLATASLCLTLIIAEFALRSVFSSDSHRPFEFRIPDPILGWSLEPNTSFINEIPEGKVLVTYNSQGWRDFEHAVEKPDGVFRILVLGDSFMEASSVKLENTFSRQLEGFAHATGKNVEVINMGVAGYGTLQEYLVFQNIGRLYDPDLILLGFYDGNDLINNSLELSSLLTEEGQITNARPFLDLNKPDDWMLSPVDFEGAERSYIEHKAALNSQKNSLIEKITLLRLLTAGIAQIPVPAFLRSQESLPEPADRSDREAVLMGVNYCVEPAEYTQAWIATERIFTKFKQAVEAYGAQLVVFTVPALEEVSLEHMKAVEADVAYPEKLCLEQAPGHARISRLLKQLDIDQISLLPDFRRAMREEGIELYQSDLHWNPKGHTLAAERILSELIRRGFLLP